jgi:hypothetical protein
MCIYVEEILWRDGSERREVDIWVRTLQRPIRSIRLSLFLFHGKTSHKRYAPGLGMIYRTSCIGIGQP